MYSSLRSSKFFLVSSSSSIGTLGIAGSSIWDLTYWRNSIALWEPWIGFLRWIFTCLRQPWDNLAYVLLRMVHASQEVVTPTINDIIDGKRKPMIALRINWSLMNHEREYQVWWGDTIGSNGGSWARLSVVNITK